MSMLIESAHPIQSLRWHRLAGCSLLITGVGHLGAELLAPGTPERVAMLAAMRGWHVSLPGAERSVEDLFLGFSSMMGVLLIGCGALIATARPTRSSSVLVVALTLVAAAAAWRYFFAVPGMLTTLAFAAAIKAWWSERAALARA